MERLKRRIPVNIFEVAARKKFRFASTRGDLLVEQLFDLSLVHLDGIARTVNTELKSLTEESFIDLKPDPRRGDLEAKLEILKYIIEAKQAEVVRMQKANERALERKRILDAINAKTDQELAGASKEDLIKRLNALDA